MRRPATCYTTPSALSFGPTAEGQVAVLWESHCLFTVRDEACAYQAVNLLRARESELHHNSSAVGRPRFQAIVDDAHRLMTTFC